MIYNTFEDDLYPCRYTHYHPNVPILCFPDDLNKLDRPDFLTGNPGTGLIKMLEPERNVFCRDTRKIALVVSSVILKMRTPAYHQDPLLIKLIREVILGGHNELADTCLLNGTQHITGNRNMLGGGIGSSGSQSEVLDFSWPGNPGFPVQAPVP